MVGRFFKWLGIFILLGIIALIGLPLVPVAKDAVTAGPAKAYVNEYGYGLDHQDPSPAFELPASIREAQFVMLGEMHGFAAMQDLDLIMLRRMADQMGMRAYLGELSPAQAIAFNALVLDGDEAPAREVFAMWSEEGAQWGNKDFFEKLQAIAAFNAGRPEAEKLVFIGTDKVADRAFAEQMLERLDPEQEAGFGSLEAMRAINGLLLDSALARPDGASRYSNILPAIRDVMGLPGAADETFYALWGLFHASKATIAGAEPLAYRLNTEGPFEGKVAVILGQCVSACFNMMPSPALPEPLQGPDGERYTLLPMGLDNPYMARLRGVDTVTGAMDDRGANLLFLPLAEERSPYTEGAKLTAMTGYLSAVFEFFDYDGPAAEVADAMFFVRSSPALRPWEGDAYDISGEAGAL